VENKFESDQLTPEQISQGWHYCYNSNRELIGPGDPKMDNCKCRIDKTFHKMLRKKNDIRQL
jgi:hypothetical protein